jgi:hypothetical protein
LFWQLSAEGTEVDLLDPDWSVMRDAWPRASYEPPVCALLAQALSRPNQVFFDVGALYGFFAVWAAKRGATVVAFEPNEQYADVLELNARRNGCEDVRIERIGLADRSGQVGFTGRGARSSRPAESKKRPYARGLFNHLRPVQAGAPVRSDPHAWRAPTLPWLVAQASDRLGLFERGFDHQERQISVSPLDEWIADSEVQPTVVKIDVHGAEVPAIRGMRRALREQVEHLIVEVHTADLLIDGTHEELLDELDQAGLEAFELHGFRRSTGRLLPLTRQARANFCDQKRWTAEQLYFMRCIYARPRNAPPHVRP